MNRDNFSKLKHTIIDQNLCTGCGTCIGLCPNNVINFNGKSITQTNNQCIGCGACVRNCPGGQFDYDACNIELFGNHYDNKKKIGEYLSIYAGHSNNANVRENASSGGIVTELALYLLESNQVDGIVTITSDGLSHQAEVRIARSTQEIHAAAQSKYKIVPTNKFLQQISGSKEKFAFIGLPCQIHGIRKAMKNRPELKKQIVFIIGLFCGFNMDYAGTEYLIRKSHIRKEDITELSYRKKVDGETGFYISNGKKDFFINKHEYTYLNLFFSPKRCQLCYDYAAEFADVSVGDAWERDGNSRIISRTANAQQLLEDLISQNRVTIMPSGETDIYSTQKSILNHKKKNIWYRWQKSKPIPEINIGKKPDDININISGKIQYYSMRLGNNTLGRTLLYFIPFGLLRKVSKALRK